jgi:hypothetical protein
VRDYRLPGPVRGGRWRAVWHEAGERQQCEAATEEKLAPKLAKIAEGLQADAPNMRRPGADLIAHYRDLDRLPVKDRWSRKHADTQRRLCERFAAGHANYRITLDMYVGTTAGVLDRARAATE